MSERLQETEIVDPVNKTVSRIVNSIITADLTPVDGIKELWELNFSGKLSDEERKEAIEELLKRLEPVQENYLLEEIGPRNETRVALITAEVIKRHRRNKVEEALRKNDGRGKRLPKGERIHNRRVKAEQRRRGN